MIQLKSLLADILNEYSSKKVKPIHENIFKAKGKFKDFLVKLFKKDDSQQIIDDVNKYEEKYGAELGNETFVDSVKLLRKIQTQRNTSTNYEQIFTSIAILTDSPVTFISDDTKKVSRVSYHVMYQRQEGNNIITFYDYFKFLYLIDGQQTDEMSSMKVHKDFTCFTSTLEGKTSGCNLSQEIRDEILKSYEDTADYETCKTYLDKIQ
jgi:hypothetical protein